MLDSSNLLMDFDVSKSIEEQVFLKFSQWCLDKYQKESQVSTFNKNSRFEVNSRYSWNNQVE
jgi:hypothetical protein